MANVFTRGIQKEVYISAIGHKELSERACINYLVKGRSFFHHYLAGKVTLLPLISDHSEKIFFFKTQSEDSLEINICEAPFVRYREHRGISRFRRWK